MAAPYTATAAAAPVVGGGSWQQQQQQPASEMRSVTPATNNTRQVGGARYASAPRMGGNAASNTAMDDAMNHHNQYNNSQRSMTPNRYLGAYNRSGGDNGGTGQGQGQHLALSSAQMSQQSASSPNSSNTHNNSNNMEPRTPGSTGLIRLSLKKPMGIVFEPMYDPNQPSSQRGVRICDLPRTGAAALSRKLQVGDELLQINDKTVSRLSFDEIMDFIIDADPESVNLLFRRPRKDTLQARQGIQQKLNAAANKDTPSKVQWVDDDLVPPLPVGVKKEKKSSKKKDSSSSSKKKRSKKEPMSEEEDTLQSSVGGDEFYERTKTTSRRPKKSKSRKDPLESDSFLDLLIDTICSNSSGVCRDTFRKNDDEYFSEDESFASETGDESTYVTFEESVEQRATKKNHKKSVAEQDTPTYDDDEDGGNAGGAGAHSNSNNNRRSSSSRRSKEKVEKTETKSDRNKNNKKYQDDGTLETTESNQGGAAPIGKEEGVAPIPPPQAPLGLAPAVAAAAPPPPPPGTLKEPAEPEPEFTEDEGNPAPIKEVEYDDRIDHGADVSVMESLGGPSLLIEKQRAAQAAALTKVPAEIIQEFGLDYPADFGRTREETIQADALKYYTYVVKGLLEEHEPEKVRLLDKLLAKYKGREDHLVQKLSVRYNRPDDGSANDLAEAEGQEQQLQQTPMIPEEIHDEAAFTDAVKKSKASLTAANAVNTAKERLQSSTAEQGNPANSGVGGNNGMLPMKKEYRNDWPEKEQKEPEEGDHVLPQDMMQDDAEDEEEESTSGSEYSGDSVDGTSPAVIAQVSELLNYVYGKTSVPGQIDRVSTIMRAYEGREAVLLELLETKALIKANKEKENADNLPSFLRNSAQLVKEDGHDGAGGDQGNIGNKLPPVTPMATQAGPGGGTVINDDISSMSGVSSPAATDRDANGNMNGSGSQETDEVETPAYLLKKKDMAEAPKSTKKPPVTPDKKKKKGLFGGLFGGKKKKEVGALSTGRAGSRSRGRKLKGVASVDGSI